MMIVPFASAGEALMLSPILFCASSEKVSEAEVAATLGVASRSAVYAICEAILAKDAAAAFKRVRELHSRGANLESLGRDVLEALRNLAVAKLPSSGDAMSPLGDLPDHEAAELRRLAERASNRDLMRLFRLMAEAHEELLRSPYPDLLMEMAVVRMATLAPVMDADELLRAIGSGSAAPDTPSSSGAAGASSSGASGGANAASARRIRVEGEVKADAPVRAPSAPPAAAARTSAAPIGPDLPEFRDFIRSRRAALAGFMEQGAALTLANDVLTIAARNDIYIRYLNDNRVVVAELATEFHGRPIRVELTSGDGLVAAASSARPSPPIGGSSSTSAAARDMEPARKQASIPISAENSVSAAQPAAAPKTRAGGPEERQAVLQDPDMRRIFDTLEARLVEVRVKPDSEDIAANPDRKNQGRATARS